MNCTNCDGRGRVGQGAKCRTCPWCKGKGVQPGFVKYLDRQATFKSYPREVDGTKQKILLRPSHATLY